MRNSRALRYLGILFLLAQAASGAPQVPIGHPAVAALFASVAAVNQAMRMAAESPLDEPSRQAVRAALSHVPAAIAALAHVYRRGELPPATFPAVWNTLGGFVDVNAADGYQKFLRAPRADLIPSTGPGFPSGVASTGTPPPSYRLVPSGTRETVDGSGGQVVDLKAWAKERREEAGAEGHVRIGFDDNRPKPASTDPSKYRLSVKPKYWYPVARLVPAPYMATNTQSSGKDPAAGFRCIQNTTSGVVYVPPPQSGGSGDSGGMQININGQQGNGQGQNGANESCGKQISEIMMARAMLIAAIAPMVVGAIQAAADVGIAGINSGTQKELARITADTSRYLADTGRQIALTQSAAAERISQNNNDGVTQRLKMQLDELRAARVDAQQAEAERRAIDQDYNQQRIDLAKRQADDNVSLARQTLNAQLTQAGLSAGFSSTRDSGSGLSVSRSDIATASGGGSGATGAGSGTASAPTSARSDGGDPAATASGGTGQPSDHKRAFEQELASVGEAAGSPEPRAHALRARRPRERLFDGMKERPPRVALAGGGRMALNLRRAGASPAGRGYLGLNR